MTPNELLLWLSARREGSWQQFRAGVQSLDLAGAGGEEEDGPLPLHQRVRLNLERLGHVEFNTEEDRWRAVPPSLALCQHADHVTAVLCGARSPRLLREIEAAPAGLNFERVQFSDSPDVIRMRAPAAEPLAAFAEREKLLPGLDSPSALLSYIPPIDTFSTWRRDTLPSGGRDWKVKQFVIEKKVLKWRPVSLDEANAPGAEGLFCFTLYQRPTYFLREGRMTVKIPGAVGKYRIVAGLKRRFLKYDRRERLLSVPAILQPPLLTERALILCSGFPPALSVTRAKRRILTYRDIPEEVAGMAAEVLKQDFA